MSNTRRAARPVEPVEDIPEIEQAAQEQQALPSISHVGLSIPLVNDVLNYLNSRPYGEVAGLIIRISGEAEASVKAQQGE